MSIEFSIKKFMIEISNKIIHTSLSTYNSIAKFSLIKILSKINIKITYFLFIMPIIKLFWTVLYLINNFSLCLISYPILDILTFILFSLAFIMIILDIFIQIFSFYLYFNWVIWFQFYQYYQQLMIDHLNLTFE